MSDFGDFFLSQEYTKIAGLGNKLGEIRDIIDWEKFRPIISDMYRDNKETGGRPHNDEILMIKMLVLSEWHGLSDYEVELQAMDRHSFRHFLGYPDKIPDRSTIWVFKEKLNEKGKVHLIWDELQRQLDERKDTRSSAVLSRIRRLSHPIRAMLRLTSLGEPKQRPGEAGTEPGARKAQNRHSGTSSTHLSIRNTTLSVGSIRQPHRCTTARLISRRKVKRYTWTKDISDRFRSPRETKP